ncbi:hypothetical protein [Endozoicomonas lisbonensis]
MLSNTLSGFLLMMTMLGNGYAAPPTKEVTLSTIAELEQYGLIVNGNSGLRLTREGTNMVQIRLYQRFLPNATPRPYQVIINNEVVTIDSSSEAHETVEWMENELHGQFITEYNGILTQLTVYPNPETINYLLHLLLNHFTEMMVPRFGPQNTLHEPIETAEAETQIGTSETSESGTQTGISETAEAGTQIGTSETTEAGTQIGTSETTEAGTQVGTSDTTEAGTQVGTSDTTEAGTQIGTSDTTEAETHIGTSDTTEAETQIGTLETAEAGTQTDESAIQADAEPPATVQAATETEMVTIDPEDVVATENPVVPALLAVAAQCGGEDNENNAPGIFSQLRQQIALTSGTIANGMAYIPKRLVNGAISTTRSLGDGVVSVKKYLGYGGTKAVSYLYNRVSSAISAARSLGNGVVSATKYLGHEGAKVVSYLYNRASGIVKPVLSAHNKSKKQTNRRLGRNRRVTAAPLLTTFHYVVFSAIGGLISVAGYYYWDVKNNLQKANQRSDITSLYLLEKARFFKKAIEEPYVKKQKQIAQLIDRFSQSHWEKHHFPITAVYEKDSHTSYIDDPLHGWQNCKSMRFGMIGYNPAPEAIIEPLDHSGPNFPVSHKQFSRRVTKTITHLFDRIPNLLNPENPAVIETIAQTLMLCGIPIGKPGQALHKECVTTVADIIGKNGLDWYQKGMHMHSMHNTQRHELTGHPTSLTFVPNFSLNQQCTHLDKLSYAPRIRQSADAPFPSLNKPFFADSGQIFMWSPEYLPKQFNLLYYPREGDWRLAQAYNDTASMIELNMAAIYGIQAAGEDDPSRILAFNNRQMIESHPAGTETKTQDVSVINSASSAPGSDRYWLYQQNDMEKIRSQRVRQDTISYLNSVRQTQFGTGVKLASIAAHIPLIIKAAPNYPIPNSPLLLSGLGLTLGVSVAAYHELLATLLSSLVYSPPYADPEQEAAERYRRLKQLRSYYLNDQNNYPHHNLLTALLSDTEAPLGVIHYSTDKESGSKNMLIANYYEPLSYVSFKQQKKFFDRAVERCARYFSNTSCDSQNPEHLDFIQFYLTMCSTTKIRSCEAMWKQNQSKNVWKIIVNQYDWTETRYPLGILNSQFNTHSIVPMIIANERRPELDLYFNNPWQGYLRNLLETPRVEPPAPVLSLKGEKYSVIPQISGISAYDNETQSLWVLPWHKTAVFQIADMDNAHSIHPVILDKNELLPPTSNRMIKWYEDNDVRVKECHEIDADYSNLFHLCKKVSDNNQKKFLIFLLNSRIRKSPWIAVYRPELEHGGNKEKLYFRFSGRIHFKDLSVERLEKHIDAIDSFYGKDRSGMVKLIDSTIITESLAEVGLVILPGTQGEVIKHFYKESYQLVFEKNDKPHNLFSECIMHKLQKDQLCAESTECVLMMQAWKLENSKNFYSHPLPVWVQGDEITKYMPVDNPDSTVVTPGITSDNEAMNTYTYDDGWQEIKKVPLTPGSDSVTHYNQNLLHISSPEPVEQGLRHFDLTIYRDGQKYTDSCPGTVKP